MITRDPQEFAAFARRLAARSPAIPRGVFMVEPENFRLSVECAEDNHYMRLDQATDPLTAHLQSQRLGARITALGIPVVRFPGHPGTPDAVFPNNAFATVPGRAIVGSMHHPVRQLETGRSDIRAFFERVLAYAIVDLSRHRCTAELTGCLVIDRARGLGFCGMSERVDEAGARRMHEAFGLAATLCFDLRPEEYHTNVIMSVLAGRALVINPRAIVDPRALAAIVGCFECHRLLDDAETRAFAGNCLALTESDVFLSQRALEGLSDESRRWFDETGFRLHAEDVSEFEKAGGSVRCMLGEIF